MLNLKTYLCSIGLFLTLGLLGVAGCSSESLRAGNDGGVDQAIVGDPAACGCQLDGYTLTISWSCFCAKHDCAPQYNVPCTGSAQLTTGCGLRQITVQTIGGPERWVYDQSGTLVGEQLGTDDSEFLCPTDPSMIGFVLRAGQFPDSCDSALTTACTADAGTINPL